MIQQKIGELASENAAMIKIIRALVEKLDESEWFLETAEGEGICIGSIKQIVNQKVGVLK